jgi:hypothetical protein
MENQAISDVLVAAEPGKMFADLIQVRKGLKPYHACFAVVQKNGSVTVLSKQYSTRSQCELLAYAQENAALESILVVNDQLLECMRQDSKACEACPGWQTVVLPGFEAESLEKVSANLSRAKTAVLVKEIKTFVVIAVFDRMNPMIAVALGKAMKANKNVVLAIGMM